MRFFNFTLQAGESRNETAIGKILTLQSATLPVEISIGGSAPTSCAAGAILREDNQFQSVSVVNRNSVPVFVKFAIGFTVADFAPADNSASINSTYILANKGSTDIPALPVAKKADGSNWGVTTGVAVDLVQTFGATPSAHAYFFPGSNVGHRRKSIVIQNTTFNGNGQDIILLNSSGQVLLRILANNIPFIFETDADIYISGYGAGVTQGAIFVHEHYYATSV
jgi:hypothetical protein